MRLVGEVPRVAARVAGNSNRGERWAGRVRDDLISLVPVEVIGKKLVVGVVDLSALDTRGDRLAVVTAGDLDVEGLGPELAVGDGAVVVDGHNLGAQHIVARRYLLGDGDGVLVAVVVEDGISSPLAHLALRLSIGIASALGVAQQSDLVDLEELEISLLDLRAVAVAGCEPSGGPTVMGAVPSHLVVLAAA